MTAPIELRFRYLEEDYVRAMRLHLSKRMRLRLDITVATGLGLVSVISLATGGTVWLWTLAAALSAGLLSLVLYAYFVLPVRTFRAEPKLQEEYLLRFAPEGIQFKSAGIDSSLDWKLYRELRSDRHTHLLLHGENSFTVVPRRVFSGPEQEQAFLALVKAAVTQARP